MWVVPSPSVAHVRAQLRTALTLANGTSVHALTAAEIQSIKAVYATYDQGGGQPDPALQPAALGSSFQALHDAFSQIQIGGRLQKLRGRLLDAADECPLCGYGEPITLDHYLPRSQFHLLAIYPRNLIPACQACNRKKGTGVPSGTDGFIHPYLDPLAQTNGMGDEPFLHADVHYRSGALRVVFRIDHPYLDDLTLGRLRHQLDKLSLNRRYTAPINTFLFGMKTALRQFRGKGAAPQRQAYLESAAEDWAEDFGVNDWHTALLRGLAACSRFCANPEPYLTRRRKRRRPAT